MSGRVALTPFAPASPYAAAKCYAYWIVASYGAAYGMHASNGILFNHEGPMRGETFVIRKITRAVAAITHGRQQKVGTLVGDATKARRVLGWRPRTAFAELVAEMVRADLAAVCAHGVGNRP